MSHREDGYPQNSNTCSIGTPDFFCKAEMYDLILEYLTALGLKKTFFEFTFYTYKKRWGKNNKKK